MFAIDSQTDKLRCYRNTYIKCLIFVLLFQAHLSSDKSMEDFHSGKDLAATCPDASTSDAASPLTARSMRLERFALALAHSQEELRR